MRRFANSNDRIVKVEDDYGSSLQMQGTHGESIHDREPPNLFGNLQLFVRLVQCWNGSYLLDEVFLISGARLEAVLEKK